MRFDHNHAHMHSGMGGRLLAGALALGSLVNVPGLVLVPISVFVALLLAPVFLSMAHRAVRRLAVATGLALATGFMTMWASGTGGLASGGFAVWGSLVLWILALPLIPAMAGWILRRLSARTTVLLMMAGGIASALVTEGLAWKGTLGIFATAFVLILLARRRGLAVLALLGMTVVSVASDARSLAVVGVAALVVQLVLHERQIRQTRTFGRTLRLAASLLLFIAASMWVLTSGLAGEQVQTRTVNQLDRANAIFGVRAEWAATTSLFADMPLGYGIGVQPLAEQVSDAIRAVREAGGDWTASYFRGVVFGERVDLHSIAANLWFHFGLAGVLLTVVIGHILIRGLRDSEIISLELGIGGNFLILMAGWDLLFSPMADAKRLTAGIIICVIIFAFSDEIRLNNSRKQSSIRSLETKTRLVRESPIAVGSRGRAVSGDSVSSGRTPGSKSGRIDNSSTDRIE